jgi:hypothetical protein
MPVGIGSLTDWGTQSVSGTMGAPLWKYVRCGQVEFQITGPTASAYSLTTSGNTVSFSTSDPEVTVTTVHCIVDDLLLTQYDGISSFRFPLGSSLADFPSYWTPLFECEAIGQLESSDILPILAGGGTPATLFFIGGLSSDNGITIESGNSSNHDFGRFAGAAASSTYWTTSWGSIWWPDESWGVVLFLRSAFTGATSGISESSLSGGYITDLIVSTPDTPLQVLARWRGSTAKQFRGSQTFGPSGLGINDTYFVRRKLVEVTSPTSKRKRKYKASYRVVHVPTGVEIFSETSSDERDLLDWTIYTDGIGNQYLRYPKHWGGLKNGAETLELTYNFEVNYNGESTTTTRADVSWDVTGADTQPTKFFKDIFFPDAVDIENEAVSLPTIQADSLRPVRKAASFTLNCDPFTVYMLTFVTDTKSNRWSQYPTTIMNQVNCAISSGDQLLFAPADYTTALHDNSQSRGFLCIREDLQNEVRYFGSPTFTNDVTLTDVIEVKAGFYFRTRDQTSITFDLWGFVSDDTDFCVGEIRDITLTKINATENCSPYKRIYWNAVGVSPSTPREVFSGWYFAASPVSTASLLPIESDLPGAGPWVFDIADGVLPSRYELDSATGEIRHNPALPAAVGNEAGIIAIRIKDSTDVYHRTVHYPWFLRSG